MRFFPLTVALSVALLARPALALPSLSLDGSYASERQRDTDLFARGFNSGLAIGLGRYFSIGGSYSQLRTDSTTDTTGATSGTPGTIGRLEYKTYSGELGVGGSLTADTDLSASAGYARSTTLGLDGFASNPKDEVQGPTGSLTLTHRLAQHFEVFLGPSYSYLGRKRGWDGNAGLGLEVARGLWVNGSYWTGQTRDGWTVGLHMDFGD